MAQALPVAYLNGSFVPIESAQISPLDRGFLFGDAVYEVIPVYGSKPMLLDAHLRRIGKSLAALQIANPHTDDEWENIVTGLIDKNGGGDIAVYLQTSRGADSGRDHVFPAAIKPTVFGMVTVIQDPGQLPTAIKAITMPDNRWGRCDIKSTSMIANVLIRQQAKTAGASDAILLRDGFVTEGGTSSVMIVEQGVLIRRPNGPDILPGTTSELVLQLAGEVGIPCREEAISEQRLRRADEVWLTSATKNIAPVTMIDGQPVGDGSPGPVWQQLAGLFAARKPGNRNGS